MIHDALIHPDDIAAITRAFPPGEERPEFDVPRFWSNTALRDPDTIIALVLSRPSTEDLARTIVAYGPERVIRILDTLIEQRELSSAATAVVTDWLDPIMKGIADAARELAPA